MEVIRGNTVLAVPPEEPTMMAGGGVERPGPGDGSKQMATGQPAPVQTYAVKFTATAEEYFRIWIVNLALTIITLGVYSAWAKVRKKRYFYGQTLIDGEGFEYRGNPVAILKGRVIAFVLLALYSAGTEFVPWLTPLFLLALAVAVPWLVVRSLAFNAVNSAYRNVQFHFRGTYAEALGVVVGIGLLVLLTLGGLFPWWKSRLARFVANNHRYGTTAFQLPGLAREFYEFYTKAAALLFGVFALGMIALAVAASSSGRSGTGIAVVLPIFVAAFYVAFLLAYASIRARVTNLTWNNATLGTVRFESTLQAGRLAWIYFLNILAIVVTLGLAIPWAVVRTMRYRCEHMTVHAAQGLDRFAADQSAHVDATGEAMGELFHIDIGL